MDRFAGRRKCGDDGPPPTLLTGPALAGPSRQRSSIGNVRVCGVWSGSLWTRTWGSRHCVPVTDALPNPSIPAEREWPSWVAVAILLILYVTVTEWLVTFGSAISAMLLAAQIVAYPLLAIAALGLIRLLGCEMPWLGRTKVRWVSILSIAGAGTVLTVRFFLKQPPSGWGANSAQDWRDIADGYLVGRVIVPITEELVFRGLFFCSFAIRKQAKSFLAVLVSACTFAALHWGPLYGFPIAGSFLDILSALAAGLAFGALRAWTGSILPGLGLHIIGNSIGF